MLVVAASLGTKRKYKAFSAAVEDVVQQCRRGTTYRSAFWQAACDPCLQVADYRCWAIQRKWERKDRRSYQLIAKKIRSEYNLFRSSTQTFY